MSSWLTRHLPSLSSLLLAAACTHDLPPVELGMQPSHTGYVPAAIAILPCRAWPAGARFKNLPLTGAKDDVVAAICASLDKTLLDGFGGQPYMRGYSPKSVKKQLDAAGQGTLLDELPQLFAHGPDSCLDCRTAPEFFERTIKERLPFRTWLLTVAKTAKNADAVLLPFVTYAYEKRFNDRGLHVAERAVGVTVLLVDTAHGELLWAGGREAAVPNERLEAAKVHVDLAPPPWEDATARLLTEDLWREFPGRQIY